MNILAFPDFDEVREILNSASAKHAFANHRRMQYSTTCSGMKFRVALIQEGFETEVKTAKFIAAATVQDLRDCFSPIVKRR